MLRLWMIIRGNYLNLIGENELLYWNRYKHCRRCPSKKDAILFEYCKDCGCPLQSKLREPLSECPQLKWGQDL